MSKELLLLRSIQWAILANTVLMILAVYFARKKKWGLHRKLNSFVIFSTYFGVSILAITLFIGWDYSHLAPPLHLRIHKWFSIPLFFLLLPTGYFGWKNQRKAHLRILPLTLFFWLGTLITGLWFF